MFPNETSYHTSPVIDVTLAGTPVAPVVSSFCVTSSLLEKADTVVLEIADYRGFITGPVKRGDPLVVKWGYAGDELVEIFRGVVRSVGKDDPVVIRGIDYNAIINSQRIQMTFEDETASGIIRAVMAGNGLGLEVEECAVEIDRFDIIQCVAEVAFTLFDSLQRELFGKVRYWNGHKPS